MTERRLTSEPPELPPRGAEYWERLATRIDAVVALRTAPSDVSWLGTYGARVGGAGVVAAAVLLAWALLQPTFGRDSAAARPVAWTQSIAPSDALGRVLAVEQPPGLGAFLLAASRSGTRSSGGRP